MSSRKSSVTTLSLKSWQDLLKLKRHLNCFVGVKRDSLTVTISTAGNDETFEDGEKFDEGMLTFLSSLEGLSLGEAEDTLSAVWARPFGLIGRLGLCDLSNVATSKAALLMAMVHVILLVESKAGLGVDIICVGSDDGMSELDTKDFLLQWPNLLPNNWNRDAAFSFRYQVRQIENGEERLDRVAVKEITSSVYILKGFPMGASKLIVNGMRTSASSENEDVMLTLSLNISDYVPAGLDESFLAQATVSRGEKTGLDGIFTRASTVHLLETVKNQLLLPLFSPVKELGIVESSSRPRSEERSNRSTTLFEENPRGFFGVPAPNPNGFGGFGPAAGFGDPDLYPNVGGRGGGMLFGPGNPEFDRQFHGSYPPVPGVPPRARFDPFAPPGIGHPERGPGGMRPFGMPQRLDPRRSFPGEPEPDHLRPPRDDDMYS